MDNAGSAEMQQNPNPNDNPNLNYNFYYSHLQTVSYSAGYPHNVDSDPYKPPVTDSHNELYVPQPGPPGVDPPYVPPSATVNYSQQPTSFEPQAAAAAAAAVAASYYQDQQSTTFDPQQAAAAASYYQDPSVSWAAAVRQYGADPYAAAVTMPDPAVQFQQTNTWKKGPKKTKVMQSAWCEVCKIDCTSKAVLDQHKLGKKHKKNLEKLKALPTTIPGPSISATSPAIVAAPPPILTASPAIVASASPASVAAASPASVAAAPPASVATASPAGVATAAPVILTAPQAAVATSAPLPIPVSAPIDKPLIGPEENPDKSKSSSSKKSRRKAASRTEDLETKRRKVLDGGAAAEAVRACSICNVVCNSDTVFRYHLAGQKHASMIKKQAAGAGVASAT